MVYRNPAKLYLSKNNVNKLSDVVEYSAFLRQSAAIEATPPIDLEKIYTHFEIPRPDKIALPKQQGTTVFNQGVPQIIIHEGDKLTRQRFTEAHELIELLFNELPGDIRIDRQKDNIFGGGKERMCQIGAANLLMPEKSFRPWVEKLGVCFESGQKLASLFQVSLIASLFRIADLYSNKTAVVLWNFKNTKSEQREKAPDKQISMFDERPRSLPPRKLRVEWGYGRYKNSFIPKNKSIPEDSSVYKAWEKDQATHGVEIIPFGKYRKKALLENKPIEIKGERVVLTLISPPG